MVTADRETQAESPITERVVKISRVAKVVKGGRHLRFSAVVVVGNGEGQVGVGMGKADSVPDAVRKGAYNAKKNLTFVTLKGTTIPHDIIAKYGGAQVMLRPAPPGTGVIAGGSVRAVVELAGVKDIVTKVRRSSNPINAARAAFKGLSLLKDPEVELAKRRELAESASTRQHRQSRRRR